MEDRKTILLKAAYELLMKQEKSRYVLNLLSETVHYDDADCDGSCLMDDIAAELEIGEYADTTPRFQNVSCSQCGNDFGPGDSGFSHCKDHASLNARE